MSVQDNGWISYSSQHFYDELLTARRQPRRIARKLIPYLQRLSLDDLNARHKSAELAIREMGISFTVYSEAGEIDRAWPFDIIPRIIHEKNWREVSRGLVQRGKALNAFINDVYNQQRIFADKIIPPELVLKSPYYKKECRGMQPAYGVWSHICGSDLVRDHKGTFYVLEDNLRIPSGVSYMLENREITKHVFPDLFEHYRVVPVDDYASQLFRMLASLSPRQRKHPCIVVLTPGIYNSAYFEHVFLAKSMGTKLVEGRDLFVDTDDCVYMRTVDGLERIDVIYRRVDDDCLDPKVFNKESLLGVPGLIRSWRQNKVAIANAPGCGVADSKAVYAYVPDMIRYYLKQKPIIDNVKTYLCSDPTDRDYVLDHIDQLVIKPVYSSGGYGITVGPHVSRAQRTRCAKSIGRDPRGYIAQPMIALSTAPIFDGRKVAPRHLDLRPFILQGKSSWVTAGGLTRVAMKENSLVVNSSQGGGSKDTWVIR